VQTILGVVDFGLGIAESASLPRVHQEMRGDGGLNHERGVSPDTLRILSGYGHRLETGETIGSTQSLLLRDDRVEGAADPRGVRARPRSPNDAVSWCARTWMRACVGLHRGASGIACSYGPPSNR